MDLNSLKDTISNLTLYDVKAGVRKAQNLVMNYTEMEAKVREATNNEPWGASSTLMQEIANGTHSYQLLGEIMPMIYKRFTEKSAEEWRQIYKALQLLEFLIKNGSERVIDDARAHIGSLKMLRQFHYIDQNGKDQGINVRNRARELAELLSDVDRIRAERKKARTTRNKYGGVAGGLTGASSSDRYGGFGNAAGDYGGYSGGVYGDGGGFGGQTSDFQDNAARGRDKFEEYDEYDEGAVASPSRRSMGPTSSTKRSVAATKKAEPQKPKEPEVDLFSFGDDDVSTATSGVSSSNGKKPPHSLGDDFGALQSGGADDDDFDDFQSASSPPSQAATQHSFQPLAPPGSTSTTTSATTFAAPKPVSAGQAANLSDMVGFSSISPALSQTTPSSTSAFSPPAPLQQSQSLKPSGYQVSQPNYFTSVSVGSNNSAAGSTGAAQVTSPGVLSPSASKSTTTGSKPSSSSGDAFGSLWSTASAGIKKSSTPTQAPSIATMAREKASAGMWGSAGSAAGQQHQGAAGGQKTGGALDDLLG